MKMKQVYLTVGDLLKGYEDNGELGIFCWDGKLDIRPPYQRNFVYKGDKLTNVIRTILEDCPLGTMYFADRENGTYEIIDGQQRVLTLAMYIIERAFSIDGLYFHNLADDIQTKILDYSNLTIYLCSGTQSERINWFRRINTAGETHTEQELLNSLFVGDFLTDAKRHFSRTSPECPASIIGNPYLAGDANRQEYLETALKWINNNDPQEYMALHQHDDDALELYENFELTIEWIKRVFPVYRKEMKGMDWGWFYREFKDIDVNPDALELEISRLMEDEEITSKRGIYKYVLTKNEKYLNIRAFSNKIKREVEERQDHKCGTCGDILDSQAQAHHIIPWRNGGKTVLENCLMVCPLCHNEMV